MNMFARFDKNPAMTQDIKKQNITDRGGGGGGGGVVPYVRILTCIWKTGKISYGLKEDICSYILFKI